MRNVIEALNELVDAHPRWGVWKYIDRLAGLRASWNHKRIYRIYRQLGLNQPRRTKRRSHSALHPGLCARRAERGVVADFMSDALYHGTRFRTFNIHR